MNSATVSSILNEGLVINTKLGSNAAWYKNIVYKSKDNVVLLCLIDSYLENMIMKGSTLVLKHTNEFFEYLFEGIITEINPEYPAHVSVTIQNVDELVNTRTFPRYETYLSSNIKSMNSGNSCFSIITNICLGGVAFETNNEFDYGEESDVHIFLPENNTISAKGKVIRKSLKNSLFDYSMQFIEMTEDTSIILSNYLFTLDENTSTLQKFFSDNIKGN